MTATVAASQPPQTAVDLTGQLQARGLVTGYGKQAAVRDVSLEIRSGEFVAIVGPNGAGKTSLISVLAGLLHCWQGSLHWQGVDITRKDMADRVQLGLSTVPQAAPAFPGLTVARNIEVAQSVCPDRSADTLPFVLELFPELLPKRSALARTLSGGQRQMLALARAMSQRPRLILLDEPSFGLAVGVRKRVVDMLAQFRHHTGCGVLMVEQDVQMIQGAQRVYFMKSGQIEQVR